MVVSILGCGWYGTALAKSLIGRGVTVKGSTTRSEKLEALKGIGVLPYLVRIDQEGTEVPDPDFFQCDHLILANNTKMDNEVAYINRIQETLKLIQQQETKQIIFVSSISVYGDHNQEVNEHTHPNPTKGSGSALVAGENLMLQNTAKDCVVLRFGGLVGPARDPARFFAGKKNIPNGLAPVNLIHLTDCIALTEKIIYEPVTSGIYNAVAPHHPTKKDFYTHAAKRSNLELPEFTDELREWKIVNSVLTASIPYSFKVANWFDPELEF